VDFTWDERKSRANERKHSVSFEEARSVFLDEQAVLFEDPDHSDDEHRFLLLGMSLRLRVLVVVHCAPTDDTIRIISARRATSSEAATYAGGWR
jgi:uncharacterized DUF497 family protein